MKPRGLIVIHQFRPITGGAELQAERLAIKLGEMGHPMQVLTQLRTLDSLTEETLSGVQVHRVQFSLAYQIKTNVVDTFRYLVKQRHTYDVIHVQQAFGHAVVAVVVARCFGKKCIIKIACAGSYGDLSVLSGFDGFKWAIQVLRHADRVIAISREVEQELLACEFSPKRIAYIPNGVDTEYFKRRQPFPHRNKVRFILIGRRHPQKGIDVMLQAARLLIDKGLGDCFNIQLYGRDFPEYDYRQMAQDLDVPDWVEFLPHSASMLEVYQSAHCFILPSRGEGLSNSLLEAMAMELAVIATSVSGTVDVIENEVDGLLIPPDTPEALASAMAAVIQNPDLAVRLGQNARRKVESQFSLDSVTSQYSELYQQLCGR